MDDRVAQSESDTNFGPERSGWASVNVRDTARGLLDRDEAVFLTQSVSTPCLTGIVKAEGAWLTDAEGKRYLDFHGNNVHAIGYGHPRLKAAITEQMDTLPFTPRRFTSEPAVALAEKLTAMSPTGPGSKLLFTTGGSDAIEVALKIARVATGRFKTVSFWDAFHGAGFGAASIGGEALFRSGIGPLLPGTNQVPPFACYRCPYNYPVDADGQPNLALCKTTCARMVDYVLEREGDVAAVIAEPARAVPYIPPPGFWKIVREACDRHGALLIFDEIPTGMGRTGKFFASDHDEAKPDIVVVGKGLGGGIVPIAAVIARAGLDVGGHLAFGHYTHEKNPVTARAALETIRIVEEEGLAERAAVLGARAIARLKAFGRTHAIIGDVRGRGLLFGVELVEDRETKAPARAAAERIMYRCLSAGLSFKISFGNVLTLTPPLILTDAELDWALDLIEAAIHDEDVNLRKSWPLAG